MKLSEVLLTEKKVKNVKSSTHPRNTLVSKAVSDIDGDVSDSLRQKLRNMVVHVIRNDKKLWTLDASKINNTMYKMVTPKEVE